MRGGEMTYTDKQIIKALEVRMPHDDVSREAYDLIQRQRAEVAREIFEDIQRNLMDNFPFLGTATATYLDELKKKYTGETEYES
jgi:hypothetical protein